MMQWNTMPMMVALTMVVGCGVVDDSAPYADRDVERDVDEPVEVSPFVGDWSLAQLELVSQVLGNVEELAPEDERGSLQIDETGADLEFTFGNEGLTFLLEASGPANHLDAPVAVFETVGQVRAFIVNELDAPLEEISLTGELACELRPNDPDALFCIGAFEGEVPVDDEGTLGDFDVQIAAALHRL